MCVEKVPYGILIPHLHASTIALYSCGNPCGGAVESIAVGNNGRKRIVCIYEKDTAL